MNYTIFYHHYVHTVKRKNDDGSVYDVGQCSTHDSAVQMISADSGEPVVLTALTHT